MVRLSGCGLFALGVVLHVLGIWCETGITGQDEYWLSLRTPMEMLERGSWLVPYLDGEPRLQKPPLFYWLVASGYQLFGIGLVPARIWGVLAAAGLAVVAKLLFERLVRRDGTIAGLLCLCAIGVAVEARRAMLDLPLAAFTALGILAGVAWLQQGRTRHAVLAGLALGLACMTKGPVALLFAGFAALAARIALPRPAPDPRRLGQGAVLLVVLLLVALPWPLWAMAAQPGFADVMQREAGSREFGFRPGSVPAVLGGGLGLLAPWTLLALAAVWRSVRGRAEPTSRWILWTVLLCVLPFLFMKSFERYTLPLVPLVAVLAARELDQLGARARTVHLALMVVVLALPGLLLCGFVLWFDRAIAAPLLALLVLGGAALAVRRRAAVAQVLLLLGLCVALLLGIVYPAIGINELPRQALPDDLARRDVAVFAGTQPGMLSVAIGRSVEGLDDDDELRQRLPTFDGYLFTLAEHEPRVRAAAGARPLQQVGEIRSLYSRKAWLRFAREDATGADWRRAFAARSLADLAPRVLVFRVGSAAPR